jgi:hypothetical protein
MARPNAGLSKVTSEAIRGIDSAKGPCAIGAIGAGACRSAAVAYGLPQVGLMYIVAVQANEISPVSKGPEIPPPLLRRCD